MQHINFLGTVDEDGLNCGVFFMRVNEWSVEVLIEVIEIRDSHPALVHVDDKSQKALEIVLKDENFRKNVAYQPRLWYNAYQTGVDKFEGERGDLLVHFHSIGGDKWSAMADLIEKTSEWKQKWNVPLDYTNYESEVEDYWERIRKGQFLVDRARARPEKDN